MAKPEEKVIRGFGRDHNGIWHVVSNYRWPKSQEITRAECSDGTMNIERDDLPKGVEMCAGCREVATRRIVEAD